MNGSDSVVVVVLGYLDVPGYGAFKRGDVAGFEKSVACALIRQRRARPFHEASPATPTTTSDTPPERPPDRQVAETTTLASPPEPVPTVAASSPRMQEAAARTYLERVVFGPRLRSPRPWTNTMPVVTASSHRLAVAVAFLREVLRKPTPAIEVLAFAKQRGISRATLYRAKRALRTVKVQKVGMRAGWVWVIHEGTLWG